MGRNRVSGLTLAAAVLVAGCGTDGGKEHQGAGGDGGGDVTPAGGASSGGAAGGGAAGKANGAGGASASSGGAPASNGGAPASNGGAPASNGGARNGGAGSGGEPSPPHVIGNCQGLGAVDAWEKITPNAVDPAKGLGVLSVATDPIHAGTVYVGTDKQGLFGTTDCGATWKKVNTGARGDVLDSGSLWVLRIDPVEPNVLYAGSLYGSDLSLQKSTNGGVDWVSLAPPGSEIASTVEYNFFQDLGIDVTDHRHLVTTFHANCRGDHAPMCLAESFDAGKTWRLFKGPLDGWGERAGVVVFGPKHYLFHTLMDGSYVTTDGGAHWTKFGNGNSHELVSAKDGSFYLGTFNWGTNRSKDGVTWETIPDSPSADSLVSDGERMFAATGVDSNPGFFTSTEDDPTHWARVQVPEFVHRLASLAIDPDHHILYSANTTDGVFRMVTR